MQIEENVPLQALNTFGINAFAQRLVTVRSTNDVQALVQHPSFKNSLRFILGGGSNIVLTGDVSRLVVKVEIMGMRLVKATDDAWIIEAGAGENWHSFVSWTIANGYYGLENLALIPGTVGATPVQNVGAYGVEVKDRFESLDAVDLTTGALRTLRRDECQFAYRDSVFKNEGVAGLKDRVLITHVRFRLPRPWAPEVSYADLQRKAQSLLPMQPTAQMIFDWVCDIRRSKLPDPAVTGNAGSFFKNPTVDAQQLQQLLEREPALVHYPQPNGRYKLAAAWLIDQCGWRGKSIGHAAVHDKHALVLINSTGQATGKEVMSLATAIQASVHQRFGVTLEAEPIVI
jgi:UDP-N-acetylmuramate dehydrogenase